MVIRRDRKTYTLDTMNDNFDSIPQVRRTDNGLMRFRVLLFFFKVPLSFHIFSSGLFPLFCLRSLLIT